MAILEMRRVRIFLVLLNTSVLMFLSGIFSSSLAETTKVEIAQAEKLRLQISSQIQLLAAGLLDDLVFQWTQSSPFSQDTPLILASLSVPSGMGTGMEVFLENHFYNLILNHAQSRIKVFHCPQCQAYLIHSNSDYTVLSKGFSQPEVLKKLGSSGAINHALFLDFEAEGTALVLRARITTLQPDLPIVHAKSLSTSTSSGSLLRDSAHLKSPEEARKEYIDLLSNRDRFVFPIRFIVRQYSSPEGRDLVAGTVPPYVWVEGGAETWFTQAQVWSGGLNFGFTQLDRAHEGWSFGGRISRLVFAEARSFVRPDLYLFGGATGFSLKGIDTVAFRTQTPSLRDLTLDKLQQEPRSNFSAWKFGAEARIKNRFSTSIFTETIPSLSGQKAGLGSYFDVGPMSFQCIGMEVGLWF